MTVTDEMVSRAIEIVKEQRYASVRSLFRRLKGSSDVKEEDFYRELQKECAADNPVIGEVDEKSATEARLQSRVLYSKDWENENQWPEGIGWKVGFDFYRRLIDRQPEHEWDILSDHDLLQQLEKMNFDHVIAAEAKYDGVRCHGYRYRWRYFSKFYRDPKKCQKKVDEKHAKAVKDLNTDFITVLSNKFLNEKFMNDVESVDGEVIVLKKRKLTLGMFKKLAKNVMRVESADAKLMQLIKSYRPSYSELEARYESIRKYLQRLGLYPQSDGHA